jgi:hypothetical protein
MIEAKHQSIKAKGHFHRSFVLAQRRGRPLIVPTLHLPNLMSSHTALDLPDGRQCSPRPCVAGPNMRVERVVDERLAVARVGVVVPSWRVGMSRIGRH